MSFQSIGINRRRTALCGLVHPVCHLGCSDRLLEVVFGYDIIFVENS